ncbi:MAG TPA: signal peptidase I [Thermoanaerobaculia bacterium]|jgi:signal peptidase I|nr:signal peptidase I [Thermoanaerobaculia bacterium]
MKSFRLVIEPIVLAVALALVARAFVHLYTIPSASMMPTLAPGDHILVTPYAANAQPQRGDVVVFRRGEMVLVKRVIATQGELIASRLGRVLIGGKSIAEPYVAKQGVSGAIDPQIIPHDCYFVLGDNRANSLDSRSWGVLPRGAIIGRARVVLWSSHSYGGNVADAVEKSNAPNDAQPPAGLRLFRPIG